MSETDNYDLVIIGAGPGGYVAAIRAAQLGMKVAVVEKRSTPGGVCLNEGCIPSKALLDSSELFAVARDRFSSHGIVVPPPTLDLSVMMRRKEDLVSKLTDGISYLFKKNGITTYNGGGFLAGRDINGVHSVLVTPSENQGARADVSTRISTLRLQTAKVLLATGSEAAPLPGIPFDGHFVVSARGALSFTSVPEHLVVVGGGAIGLELGSVWRRLGARVTIIEMLPQLLPHMDRQSVDSLYRSLRKQGIQFRLGTKITGFRNSDTGRVVTCSSDGETAEIECDRLLVAAGRRPVTSGLGLDELRISTDDSGRLVVDEAYQTTSPGIYAVGDIVAGPMLAHKASEEGLACVELMNGIAAKVDYGLIPGVVYTSPEAAGVGKTEEQLKQTGVPYRTGRFNFAALGRARCMDETDGFVKVIAHEENDRLLGIHIVGPRASDLIAEAAAFMTFCGTARDIALTCHAHPTLAEALREAALDVHKEAIHIG